MRRRLAFAALALVATGCSTDGLLGGGLPGGAVGRGEGYEVVIVFDDVLDLVNQSAVKVKDITIGAVVDIDLDGFQARVKVRLKDSVKLPENAVARLRQTSLLGEKFIELAAPSEGATGELSEGDVIPALRSARNPDVEEVFTALSTLLNGGGLQELQTIAVELSSALAGREDQVRSVLHRIDRLVGALDERKLEVVRAIDSLDRLTATFAAQRQSIADALEHFTPALTVLADQRVELTRLLQRLSRVGEVGSRVVRASHDDTIASLRMLAPIVGEVAKVKTELARSIDQLVRFTRVVPRAIPGDYLQLLVTLYFDPSTLPVAPGTPLKTGALPRVGARTGPATYVPPSTGARSLRELLTGGAR